MKRVKMVIKVEDDFEIGDCKNCPLAEYRDSFGEMSCYEGECIDNSDCPLRYEDAEEQNEYR